MLVSCTSCHREYVASNRAQGEHFTCSRCQGVQNQKQTRLGLHPALEKKWADQPVKPKKVDEGLSQGTSGMPKIPGYEVSFQIGRGAMGSVYRARQSSTGRMVAIKILSQELSERADLIARFEREACALKSLTNENVVAIIDAGHVGDIHYFVMEFIDGITLRARIGRGPIELKEACFITSDILKGLREAHKHGIIHRDLKPENVLLAYNGNHLSSLPERAVVVDFGLVGIGGLAFDPHPNLTRSRVTMGTVNYMAPEQHVDAKRVDHRSDIYSAGVILFEMLTGELPLGRYTLPHERGLPLPQEIDEILSLALSRKVEDRYFSTEQFLADLSELVKEKAPDKSPEIFPQIFQKLQAKAFDNRYALMLVLAGMFFAFGIKLSLS